MDIHIVELEEITVVDTTRSPVHIGEGRSRLIGMVVVVLMLMVCMIGIAAITTPATIEMMDMASGTITSCRMIIIIIGDTMMASVALDTMTMSVVINITIIGDLVELAVMGRMRGMVTAIAGMVTAIIGMIIVTTGTADTATTSTMIAIDNTTTRMGTADRPVGIRMIEDLGNIGNLSGMDTLMMITITEIEGGAMMIMKIEGDIEQIFQMR